MFFSFLRFFMLDFSRNRKSADWADAEGRCLVRSVLGRVKTGKHVVASFVLLLAIAYIWRPHITFFSRQRNRKIEIGENFSFPLEKYRKVFLNVISIMHL